jgi:hypothetical protein
MYKDAPGRAVPCSSLSAGGAVAFFGPTRNSTPVQHDNRTWQPPAGSRYSGSIERTTAAVCFGTCNRERVPLEPESHFHAAMYQSCNVAST